MNLIQKDLSCSPNDHPRDLSVFHDIPLHVSVEIGRVKYRVRDLMKLAPDSILELEKPAGEPLDICINGHAVARGEVMVSGQMSGVRIVEVCKPAALAGLAD